MHRRALLLATVAFSACTLVQRTDSPSDRPRVDVPRRPVILVPGVTGSILAAADGTVEFGGTRQFFLPRDGGYGLASPVGVGRPLRLHPRDLIREIRIPGLFRKPIYQPIIDLLLSEGYELGDVAAPASDRSLYLFAYDWRQDNVETATKLADLVNAVRSVSAGERVDLVCQSNGAHVCRWAARFGNSSLEAAELVPRPESVPGVGRLVLVGASNGGSLRILREMNRGRRYVPLVGRRFRPEIFFTFASLYVDLPASSEDLFLDSDGSVVEVDLYDPASWERYGWSIFAPAVAKNADRTPSLFGEVDDRRSYLERQLDRARRVQALLIGETGAAADAYFLVENDGEATPRRAVLVREAGDWRTVFAGDRWLRSRPRLAARTKAAGDGHSVVASQRHLSPIERARLHPPRRVSGGHFEMLLEPATRGYLREVLTTPSDISVADSGKAASPPSRN